MKEWQPHIEQKYRTAFLDKRGIRVDGARSNGVTDSDEIEDGIECYKDDEDTDYESEISDLPSLTDLFSRSRSGFEGSAGLGSKTSAPHAPVDATVTECWGEGDCENSASPIAATAAGIQLGASQDHPIMVDDDQPHPRSREPGLSQRSLPNLVEDGKDSPDSLAKYGTDNPIGDEEEGGSNESHRDGALHTPTLTRGNGSDQCSGSGTGTNAPASVGQIHDVFEETFGMARQKQKTVVATVLDCPDRDGTAGSIPPPVSQGGPRSAAVDGAANMERLAEAVRGDIGHNYLPKGEIENGSPFQPRQESDGQETRTEDVRSQCLSVLFSDCHSESASAFTEPSASPLPTVMHEPTGPGPGNERLEGDEK